MHASLYERAEDGGLGYNTAIVVGPDGSVVARTRKLHIPVTAGYYEDKYFRPGDDEKGYPVVELGEGRFGFPTCWDQWFPELARAYSLGGAEVIVYPTAIGSEPDHPDFDTEPLWERVITGNGIANGTFMVAVNRIGDEPPLRFYGSSFISDPYGRVLVQAPRDEPAVLVADLDLDQRRDWLALFPFLQTRRPETYAALLESVEPGLALHERIDVDVVDLPGAEQRREAEADGRLVAVRQRQDVRDQRHLRRRVPRAAAEVARQHREPEREAEAGLHLDLDVERRHQPEQRAVALGEQAQGRLARGRRR